MRNEKKNGRKVDQRRPYNADPDATESVVALTLKEIGSLGKSVEE